MTEHLPECPLLEPCSADTPNHGFCSRQNTICIHCERQCFCERLLACERRVRTVYAISHVRDEQAADGIAFGNGYAAGIDAAEAAVERAHDWYELSEGLEGRAMMKCDALAAIDALKESK